MIKFGRNYRLTIQSGSSDPDIVIEYPLTMQFDVQRSAGSSLNNASIVIYNLNPTTRRKIFKDRFSSYKSVTGKQIYQRVILEAGYGNNMPVIFQGNLFECTSQRKGTDVVTMITARDGGFDTETTQSFLTLAGNQTVGDIIKTLIGQFPNLNQGAIGPNNETLKRPAVIDGSTWDALKLYSAYNVFIDSEKVYVLANDEALDYSGEIALIDASTGLLETPRRSGAGLEVATLFEPRIQIGQYIQLKSTIQPEYDGNFKVISVSHRGIISGRQNGQCQSVFGLLLEGQLYAKFNLIKEEVQRVNLDTPPVAGTEE